MKNRMIKVGNVVPSLKVANISYNTEQIKQAILDHQDCSILLFPELCISGYTCADLFSHDAKIYIPTYSEFYESRWFTSGKEIKDTYIQFENDKVPFSKTLLIEDPQSGAVVGCDICEDLWVADKPSTHACLAGANIIVNLSASDELIGKEDYRRSMVSQQSSSCYCAYCYVSSGVDE